MIRRPPRSTLSSSSAASDVYKRQKYDCEIIGLTMGQAIPIDADERIALAYEIVCAANELEIPNERIIVDPIILPVGVDVGQQHAAAVQEVVKMIQDMFDPPIRTTCGLSK